MDKSTAINIIEEILKSYREHPEQNHFEITISSYVANNSGGTGFLSSPIGGASGSTTIGMQSSMDGAQLSIAQSRANDAINNINEGIMTNLDAIIESLKNDKSDQSKISNFFSELIKVAGTTAMTTIVRYVLKSQGFEV